MLHLFGHVLQKTNAFLDMYLKQSTIANTLEYEYVSYDTVSVVHKFHALPGTNCKG